MKTNSTLIEGSDSNPQAKLSAGSNAHRIYKSKLTIAMIYGDDDGGYRSYILGGGRVIVCSRRYASREGAMMDCERWIKDMRGMKEKIHWLKGNAADVQQFLIDCGEAKRPSNKPVVTIDGYTRAEFIQFLTDTLIPDLEDSGMVETAKDFKTAVKFMQTARHEAMLEASRELMKNDGIGSNKEAAEVVEKLEEDAQ